MGIHVAMTGTRVMTDRQISRLNRFLSDLPMSWSNNQKSRAIRDFAEQWNPAVPITEINEYLVKNRLPAV